jgi:exopolyphosphatase/guanosine-5'-triphosphate,3'-diphosphate pyrophosphatase
VPKGSNNTRASAEERPPCYAAIDLGTNNCRMLVARPGGETNADGFRVIDGYSRIVRLGEGLAASGRLSDEAIERTIKALKVCAGKIRSRGVKETRAIATEACRQAANGDDFLGRVEAETGLTMKIISAVDEAELTVAGCAPLLKTGHPKALIFDIGGGSTELMWIDFPSGGPPKALDILSLPIGVVGLAEEFGKDALAPETFEIIVGRVTRALAPFEDRHRIAAEIEAGGVHMLGTSGTVTTLGAIYLDLPRYDRSRVDGLSIRMESIDAICAKLIGLDYDSRHHHPCIGPGRADLMAMGCAVITAIRRHWPATNLTAADRGIREGLLLEMIATAPLAPIEAP